MSVKLHCILLTPTLLVEVRVRVRVFVVLLSGKRNESKTNYRGELDRVALLTPAIQLPNRIRGGRVKEQPRWNSVVIPIYIYIYIYIYI